MIKNKKGFTLIELIIVMAIIGILAVVAIVAISGKAQDARNARRLADMSAVRTAFAISCADDEDTMATTATDLNPVLCLTTGISNLTFSNVKDPSVTACAVDTVGCNATAGTATATCQYGYGAPATGDAFANAGAVTTWLSDSPYCNYRVNFKLEGQTAKSSATDEGLVQ